MNEKRFLELVNLYLDEEIAKEELEELEREMETDSYRREVFNRYCRLQRAAEVVSRDYGNHLASTVDFKNYHILARHSQRRVRIGFLYSAGALAAACLTVAAALHVMESSMDYTELPPIGADERFADVSVEIFESGEIRHEIVTRGSNMNRTLRQAQAGFPAANAAASSRGESVRFRDSRRGEAKPSPQVFQASMRFEAENYRAREAPPVFNSEAGMDASFTDFASFQFQR